MSFESLIKDKIMLCPGDSWHALRDTPDNRYDSIVCDPPYALVSIVKRFGNTKESDDTKTSERVRNRSDGYARLTAGGFMGKQWDTGEAAHNVDFWTEALRVLKPGGHLVAFSGTRTYHRMACAIEDAGFEIRDQLQWIYGAGFPKSHNIGDGWGTALKPAHEPIVLARKPLSEKTVAANVLRWGTGALNISACRVPTSQDGVRNNPADSMAYTCLWHEVSRMHHNGDSSDLALSVQQHAASGHHSSSVSAHGPEDQLLPDSTNDYLTCSHCDGEFPRSAIMPDLTHAQRSAGAHILRAPESCPKREHILLDLSMSSGHTAPNVEKEQGRWPANVCHDGSDEVVRMFPTTSSEFGGDSGSAARFFYSAKADSDDRLGSKHPTVKPVDLMQWLVRLVTPKGGLVLDPFAGTGTTGEACFREGMRCMLIEREAEYQDDIRRRMRLTMSGLNERSRESIKAKSAGKPIDLGPLFAMGDDIA